MAKNPLLESDGASTGFGKSLCISRTLAHRTHVISKSCSRRARSGCHSSCRSGPWVFGSGIGQPMKFGRADRRASFLGSTSMLLLTRDSLLAAIHPSDRPGIVKAIRSTVGDQDTVEMELRAAGRRMESAGSPRRSVRIVTRRECSSGRRVV